ncbi:MAG TPA: hypothetical protein VF823_10860 [Anaerolineales bacterium]
MEEALSFFRAFEVWIYLLLGLGALIYIRKFILAWGELREAAFGLERDNAQARLNQSASILVLLLMMAVSEFVVVSFIVPEVPGATPLLTPTLNLLTTPTTTLLPTTPVAASGTVTNTISQAGTAAATPGSAVLPNATGEISATGCITGEVYILSPAEGQQISGVVPVTGTANIPNFGFYRYETKRPDETIWLTLQVGNTVVQNGRLGDWDTQRLQPGDYQLGLVIVDNQGKPLPPCVIKVHVARTESTPEP